MLFKSKIDAKNIYLVVDNLRIGGIQRLLLDECYQFLKLGFSPQIICLAPPLDGDHILNVDFDFPISKDLKVTYLSSKKTHQFVFLMKEFLRSRNSVMFISHSASGAFLLRMCAIITIRRITILLLIHQLLSFSDKKQTLKRVFYSFFATKLIFSSKQFLLDWNMIISKNNILKIFSRKPQKFVRMGVYLPRLNWNGWNKKQLSKNKSPDLIFLSRPTKWKGFEKFVEISTLPTFLTTNSIIFSTQSEVKNKLDSLMNKQSNTYVLFNCGITSVSINPKSVHIYPSNYGPNVLHPQSIGMNVLEMISQNIPSLISIENFESWPEFQNSILVRPVDWDNLTTVTKEIVACIELSESVKRIESQKLNKVISIEDHCTQLIDEFSSTSKTFNIRGRRSQN